VAGTVRDDLLERLRLPERQEHGVGDLLDARFDAAPDVVGLADLAALEDGLDGPAVVEHVQPLPLVPGRFVQGQGPVVEGVRGEQRMTFSGNWKGP